MHIPDGVLSGELSLGLGAVSTAAVGWSLWRGNHARSDALDDAVDAFDERQVPLLGMTAAFLFAAQMINFPIGFGTSGHFLGAALAAVLLGPLRSVLVLAVVLVIQCFLFQDGGFTALGANVFNMGIVGGLVSYGCYRLGCRLLPKTRKARIAAAGVAAWFSVVAASAACALELALSGKAPTFAALGLMSGAHALVGVGEALITMTVLSTVAASRPDLIPGEVQEIAAPELALSTAGPEA